MGIPKIEKEVKEEREEIQISKNEMSWDYRWKNDLLMIDWYTVREEEIDDERMFNYNAVPIKIYGLVRRWHSWTWKKRAER